MLAHGQFRNELHYPLYLGSPWRSIVSRRHIVARTAAFAVLFVCLLLTGCHSSSKTSFPIAAFSRVPAAYQESPYKTDINEGGDYKTDILQGSVTGARPDQQIVSYANTDGRWGLCRVRSSDVLSNAYRFATCVCICSSPRASPTVADRIRNRGSL